MALESNINGLWWAKQAAKGSPATMTAASKRGRWVGGDLQTNRADGSEPWSDGSLFGDAVDFVNTLVGNGNPVLQGQSGVLAHLAWLACGQETVTGGVNAVHTLAITGGPAGGSFTLALTVGGEIYTTAAIAYNATAAAVQTAILAAAAPDGSVFPAAGVAATGGPLPGSAVTLTFGGAAGNQVVGAGVTVSSLTGGSSPAVTDIVATPGQLFQHVATPADTGGFYLTMAKSVGKSVVHRSQYNDCRIQSLRVEGSSASKVVKVTPTFVSLDPGQIITADPSKVDDATKPFVYTEGQGTFTIDGQVYTGQSSFALVLTWGLAEFYGDDVLVNDITNTLASVQLEAITIVLNAAGLSRYNQQIYGTATPGANAKPIKTVPPLGSYSCQFTRPTGEYLKVEVPGVKWDPNLNIPANPAGGNVEFPMAAQMRKVSGQPPFRLTVGSYLDAAYTV